jgi:hypothetical protein
VKKAAPNRPTLGRETARGSEAAAWSRLRSPPSNPPVVPGSDLSTHKSRARVKWSKSVEIRRGTGANGVKIREEVYIGACRESPARVFAPLVLAVGGACDDRGPTVANARVAIVSSWAAPAPSPAAGVDCL